MAHAPPASDARLLALLMLVFILYGSLYPFHFQALPEGLSLREALIAAWHAPPGGRGDLLANVTLYMPLGFALVAATGRLPALLSLALGVLACAALSAGVETAQLTVPERTASGWDLVLNVAGGAAGALAASLLGRFAPRRMPVRDGAAALVLAGWLAYRLYPFVPAIDQGEWIASVRPLGGAWAADPVRSLRLAGAWLVAARVLSAATPGIPPAIMMLAVTAAAVPIIDRVVTPAEVLAVLIALPAWWLVRGRRHADAVLLGVLLAVILAEGLAPYRLATEPHPFGWVPFVSVIRGQYFAAVQAMMLKTFLYGGLLWLAAQCGVPRVPAALATVGLALAISMAQTWLPGRSAEVTDATLALTLALVLRPGLRAHRR